MQDSVHIYNPLNAGRGVGRRTGKVIQKKRNINNGVENFEDYLSSDGDMTLNVTGAQSLKNNRERDSDSMHSKGKQAMLDLQTLPHSEIPEDGKIANLLTRNSKFGRRTGKIIEKKRNINNGVDNFEDYLSSDGEVTLNVTNASSAEFKENHGNVSTRLSKKAVSQSLTKEETHLSRQPQKPETYSEVLQDGSKVNLVTRNSRFGRRTGKDLLAGKEHMDLSNFSNYLSDSNETGSLHPSPLQVSRRRPKSAVFRHSTASLASPRSNAASSESENNGVSQIQDSKRKSGVEKSSDEENPLKGLSSHSQPSFISKGSDLPHASETKSTSPAIDSSSPNRSSGKESDVEDIDNSQRKKRLRRKSTLAVLAIKNSAKRKSRSEIEKGSENGKALEINGMPKKDNASREQDEESQGEDANPSKEPVTRDDIGSPETEHLNVSQVCEVEVDESIYFKVAADDDDVRESLDHYGPESPETEHLNISKTYEVEVDESIYFKRAIEGEGDGEILDRDGPGSPEIGQLNVSQDGEMEVDDSIYFKLPLEGDNGRQSLNHSRSGEEVQPQERERVLSRTSSRLTRQSEKNNTVNTDGQEVSDQGNDDTNGTKLNLQQKLSKKSKANKKAASTAVERPKRGDKNLRESEELEVYKSKVSSREDSNGKNARVNITESENHVLKVQSYQKSCGLRSGSKSTNKNNDEERFRKHNVGDSDDNVGTMFPEKDVVVDDSPEISFKSYEFNDSNSDSTAKKSKDAASRDASVNKKDVNNENSRGRKRWNQKQNCSKTEMSENNSKPVQLRSEVKQNNRRRALSNEKGENALEVDMLTSHMKSNNGPQFMSVSSKAEPNSSGLAGVSLKKSLQNISKQSVRRMLDLSQGEEAATSDTEGITGAANPGTVSDDHIVLKGTSAKAGQPHESNVLQVKKRGKADKSKNMKELHRKVNLGTTSDETDIDTVFMSISSKTVGGSAANLHCGSMTNKGLEKKQNKSGKNVTGKKFVPDASKTVSSMKTSSESANTDISNAKDGLLKGNTKERRSSDESNTDSQRESDTERKSFSKSSEKSVEKTSGNQTFWTELHKSELAEVITKCTKPSLMELKDTPKTGKTGDRQRFKNHKRKIFTAGNSDLYDCSGYKQFQHDNFDITEDRQDIVKLKKTSETTRKPETVAKKLKSKKLKEQRKTKKNPQKVIVKKRRVMQTRQSANEELEALDVDEPRRIQSPLETDQEPREDYGTERRASSGDKLSSPEAEVQSTDNHEEEKGISSSPTCNVALDYDHEQDVGNQMEIAVTYFGKLKSASSKKRRRSRKSSLASRKRKSSPHSGNPEEGADSMQNTPVSLRLIDSLPCVTPRSGVSFRKMRKGMVEEDDHISRVSNHSYHQDTDNSVELNTPHAVSKKGRPRKLSVASGKQGVSQSLDSGGVPNPDENGTTSTPMSLRLINSLPHVTPQSGVSLRRPKNQNGPAHNGDSPDPYEFSLQRFKRPDPESTPCGRIPKQVNGLTSCLKDSSAVRPFKKGQRVRISNFVVSQPAEAVGERMSRIDASSITMLSPSSSPVHYAETTHSGETNTSQRSFVLPDLSHFISRPEPKEDGGLRRSSRTRVKPVAAYKGERVIYRRDSTGYGLVVDTIQPSVGEAKLRANEEKRRKNRVKQRLKAMNIPVKPNRRLSSHVHDPSLEVTQADTMPAVDPETQEEVLIELIARRSNVCWQGPELEPVLETDPIAICRQLQQPSFSSGEIQLRALGEKAYEETMATLISTVIIGKVMLTINEKSTAVETGDDFCIPRGSAYGIKNLRRAVARLHFVCLHDNPQMVI